MDFGLRCKITIISTMMMMKMVTVMMAVMMMGI
jgi:hypothetical protein